MAGEGGGDENLELYFGLTIFPLWLLVNATEHSFFFTVVPQRRSVRPNPKLNFYGASNGKPFENKRKILNGSFLSLNPLWAKCIYPECRKQNNHKIAGCS